MLSSSAWGGPGHNAPGSGNTRTLLFYSDQVISGNRPKHFNRNRTNSLISWNGPSKDSRRQDLGQLLRHDWNCYICNWRERRISGWKRQRNPIALETYHLSLFLLAFMILYLFFVFTYSNMFSMFSELWCPTI